MQATGVPEQALIERAAEAFVKAFLEAEPTPDRVLVLAGPGNNGADARAVARRCKKQAGRWICGNFQRHLNVPGGKKSGRIFWCIGPKMLRW